MRDRSRFLLEQLLLLLLQKSFFICLSQVFKWFRIKLLKILDFYCFVGLVWFKFCRDLLFVWESITKISWYSSDLYSFAFWPNRLFWAFKCLNASYFFTRWSVSNITLLAIRISPLLAFCWFCCSSCFPLKSEILGNSIRIYCSLTAVSWIILVFVLLTTTSMNTLGMHLGNLSQRDFKLLIASFWSLPHLSCIHRILLRMLRNTVWCIWLI